VTGFPVRKHRFPVGKTGFPIFEFEVPFHPVSGGFHREPAGFPFPDSSGKTLPDGNINPAHPFPFCTSLGAALACRVALSLLAAVALLNFTTTGPTQHTTQHNQIKALFGLP